MPGQEGRVVAGRGLTGPDNTPRLRLKPKAAAAGHVDGAWWPHSDDLPKELPDLLAVLSVRLGPISRVMYNLTDWAIAPSKLLAGGRPVQLEASWMQATNTLELVGIDRRRMALLVVPPRADPDIAHETMMTAAAPNNASTVDDLLMISGHTREARTRTVATEHRWTAAD
jgi:hypothetical protein